MKNKFLILSLLVCLFFTACSSDDNALNNTAPTAPILEISKETANKSITFSWVESTDEEGDPIVYDFHENGVVIVNDLKSTEYVWEIDGTENHKYPARFFVVAADGTNGSKSNEISVQDPIIGTWQKTAEVEDGVEIELSECELQSTMTFSSNGNSSYKSYDQFEGECFFDSSSAEWYNNGNNEYGFLLTEEGEVNEGLFSFSNNNNTLSFEDTFEGVVTEYIYARVEE